MRLGTWVPRLKFVTACAVSGHVLALISNPLSLIGLMPKKTAGKKQNAGNGADDSKVRSFFSVLNSVREVLHRGEENSRPQPR